MPMSNYSGNKVLDAIFGAASLGAPGTYYAALFTAAPSGSGGGTEVSGGSYSRFSITNNSTNFPAAIADVLSNGTAWDFGTATGNWGTIVAWALFDASSGGNMWFYGNLSASRTINNGDSFSIPTGSAQWTAVTS
jgi:hypothetical protein